MKRNCLTPIFLAAALAGLFTVAFGSPSSAATCEGVFQSGRPDSILSPTSFVGQIRKERLVKGLLYGKGAVLRTGSASSGSRGPKLGSVTAKDVNTAADRPGIGEKKEFPIASAFVIKRVRWLDSGAVLLQDEVHGGAIVLPASADPVGPFPLTLVRAKTEAKFDWLFSNSSANEDFLNSEYLAEAEILVARQPYGTSDEYTYRFLDKQNFKDLREPLHRVTELAVHGRFLTYRQDGHSYITSVRPSDFGASHSRKVVREIPWGYVLSVSADGASVYISNGMGGLKQFDYDPSRQEYRVGKNQNSYFVKAPDGAVYVARRDSKFELQIHRFGTADVQRITSDAPISNLDHWLDTNLRLVDIFGDGSERTAVVRIGMANYAVLKIGDRQSTDVGSRTHHGSIQRIGQRFLIVSRKSPFMTLDEESLSFLTTDHSDAVIVDRFTGATHVLPTWKTAGYLKASTSVYDANQYAQVQTDVGSDFQLLGKITLREYGSNQQTHHISFQGTATLMQGTRVARVENRNTVSFVDIISGVTLWFGDAAMLPRLSPDGSRVAYVKGNVLTIEVIGEKPESRRTY